MKCDEIVQRGDRRFAVTWEIDDSTDDNDFLGKFQSKIDGADYYVDRCSGVLYGRTEQHRRAEALGIENQCYHLYDEGGCPIIADGLRKCSRNEYRYWIPAHHVLPHDPKQWDKYFTNAMKHKFISEYGSLENADIAHAIDNYNRHTSYGESWWYEYVTVQEVDADGEDIGESRNLGGIDSDSTEVEKNYHEQELIDDLVTENLQLWREREALKCKTITAQ